MKAPRPSYAKVAFFKPGVSVYFVLVAVYFCTLLWFWPAALIVHRLLAMVIAPILIWLSVKDVQSYEIPNRATFMLAIIAVAFLLLRDPELLPSHLGTGVIVTAFLWGMGSLFYQRTQTEGLGIGDAKLFGAGALLLGPWKLPELFLLASIGGIVVSIISQFGRTDQQPGIPFGPFIAYAIFVLSFVDPLFIG